MEVNASKGKTEVMLFAPDSPSAAQPVVPPGGWTVGGVMLNVTDHYDYLGYAITPALDAELPLRSRLPAANFALLRVKALPHGSRGLRTRHLDLVYRTVVQSQLEVNAGVWAPRAQRARYLYEAYATPRAVGCDSTKGCPFVSAARLQMRAAEHVLGRHDSVPRDCRRLRFAKLLSWRELGWPPMASRWDLAGLRLFGNILAAPEGHPMLAVARCLLTDHHRACGTDGAPPAAVWPKVWNWMTVTLDLIAGADEGAAQPLKLADRFDNRTLRLVDAAAASRGWRAAIRRALHGLGGRDARAWILRLARTDRNRTPYEAATRMGVDAVPPSLLPVFAEKGGGKGTIAAPPASTGALTPMQHAAALVMTAHHATTTGMATARKFCRGSAAVPRSELCASATEFVPPERGADAAPPAVALPAGSGRLWGISTCPECAGAPTYDVWHCLAECRVFDDDRRAALTAAATAAAASPRFKHLEPAFRQVRDGLHTAAGQAFVFLAAVGVPIPAAAAKENAHGFPFKWAECLVAPASVGTQQHARNRAVVAVTFPAFDGLVRAVAQARALPALAQETGTDTT